MDFKMAARCFTLLCTSFPVAFGRKIKTLIPRKMVNMWKLSSYGRNIEIQDGRHIISHAVFKERQMSLTLVFYISISFWFRWQPYSISR